MTPQEGTPGKCPVCQESYSKHGAFCRQPEKGTPVPEREDLEKEAIGIAQHAAKYFQCHDQSLVGTLALRIIAFGKAQRERGRILGHANAAFDRGVFYRMEDTALLRECEGLLAWVNDFGGDSSVFRSKVRAVLPLIKARLSPKESGGQGRAGG